MALLLFFPSSSFSLISPTQIQNHIYVHSFETAERSIFDESGIGYTDSHIENRIECTELGNSGKTYVQMKSEPTGGASSPESTAETNGGPDDCAGCGRLIQVYIWHLCTQYSINRPIK